MVVTTAQRVVGKVAAFLGVIQGLTWTALSLTCIIIYNRSQTVDLPTTYNEYLQYSLFHQYLSDPILKIEFVIRPFDFTIFMWVYYFLSIGWLVASLDLFAAVQFNKRRQSLLMVIWGVLTSAISIIDLIFTGLLVRDYTACSDLGYDDPLARDCYLTIGIMMTIAARGYTLLVVNVVFAYLMISFSQKIIRNDNLTGAFYDYTIPRAKIPSTNSTLERSVNENSYTNNSMGILRQHPAILNQPNNSFY